MVDVELCGSCEAIRLRRSRQNCFEGCDDRRIKLRVDCLRKAKSSNTPTTIHAPFVYRWLREASRPTDVTVPLELAQEAHQEENDYV